MKNIVQTLLRPLCGLLIVAGASGLCRADASTFHVGFEVEEGFTIGSNAATVGTPARAWVQTGNSTIGATGRVAVSDAYAFSGQSSLSMSSGTTVTAVREFTSDVTLTEMSWSFLNPTATHANEATTSWVYLFAYDATTEGLRALQFTPRFGTSATGASIMKYQRIDSGGVSTTLIYTDTAGLFKDWDEWNTLNIKLDLSAKTYSIAINGVVPTALSAISLGNWDLTTITKVWMASPAAGTVYYDDLYVIPEPGSIAMMLTASGGLLLTFVARRQRRTQAL